MYGIEDTIKDSYLESYVGKVVILREKYFKEEYRKPEYQLFLAQTGFGCEPDKIGRAVYGTFLYDGEYCRVERNDVLGVIKEERMPEWAKSALAKYREERMGK